MKYIQTLLAVLILLVLLFLAFHCGTKPTPTQTVKKGKDEKTVTKIDVKADIDNPKPKSTYAFTPTVIHDTIHDTIPYFNPCDSIRVYTYSNDTITVIDSIQGRLIKQTVLYTMYNTDTKRVDTIFVKEFKPFLALGATLQLDSIGYIKPAIGMLYVREKASYSVSINSDGRATIGGYFNLRRK